jgi:hypothetical protein
MFARMLRSVILVITFVFSLSFSGMREWVVNPNFGPQNGFPVFLPFPDSIAGSSLEVWLQPTPHTQASLLGTPAATSPFVMGSRRMTAGESAYLRGLQAFHEGRYAKAAEGWGKNRRLSSDSLEPYAAMGRALLLLMAEEPNPAEKIFQSYVNHHQVQEAAWRNLFSLYLASGRPQLADGLMDSILFDLPRHPFALVAKAMILRHLRPDSEWEEFIRKRTRLSDSLPDLQIAYGQFLLEHGRLEESVRYLSAGLAAAQHRVKGWLALAESQYQLGYHFFALDCLSNVFRLGGEDARSHELYARVLRACCMEAHGQQGEKARKMAEKTLEKGLPQDFSRRPMAQLLYHVYAQNQKPAAAKRLREDLWFHFQGPAPAEISLLQLGYSPRGLEASRLSIAFGLHSFDYVRAFQSDDQFHAL